MRIPTPVNESGHPDKSIPLHPETKAMYERMNDRDAPTGFPTDIDGVVQERQAEGGQTNVSDAFAANEAKR